MYTEHLCEMIMRKFLKNSEATLLNCPLGKGYNSIIDVNKDIFPLYIILEYITSSSEVYNLHFCMYIFKLLKMCPLWVLSVKGRRAMKYLSKVCMFIF